MHKRVCVGVLLGHGVLLLTLQAVTSQPYGYYSHRHPDHPLSYSRGARRAYLPPAYVPNFHYVDAHVYRGAQPAPIGWNALAKLGITLVIDLRRDGEVQEHWTRSEQEAVEAAGMRYLNIPMSGWRTPDDQQVLRIIATLESGERVFVHCRSGKDRTGTVIACYRIAHDHWTSKRALSEAASYGMNPHKIAMQRYILSFHP